MRIKFTRKFSLLVYGAIPGLLVWAGCDRATKPVEPPTAPPRAVPAPGVDASPFVERLAVINVTNGPVSATAAAEWKSSLTNLIALGPGAIPAIESFLLKNVDLSFEPHGNAQLLAVPSLRLALISALTRIGGPEVIALTTRILGATADPQELAAVAGFLQQAEPDKHRAAFAAAARETLALAAAGPWDGRDVAPLFGMLQRFGGTNDLPELTRHANKWFAYTAITLAHWPRGEGIPLLIQIVQSTDGRFALGRDIYFRMLAESAVHSPPAADALVAEVRRNVIEVGTWPGLGRALAGESLHLPELISPSGGAPNPATSPRTYHLAFGNQTYQEKSLPESAPANELGARINLVDRLLEATTNPAAIDAFEAARISLSARLPKAR